jgi:hypothetical protein
MAKNNRGDRSKADAQYNELDSAASAWRRINDAKAKGQQYDTAALRYLEQQYQTLDKLEGKIDDIYGNWGDLTDEIEKSNKKLTESLENFDDIDSSLISIGNRIGKNSGLYQTQLDRTNQMKATMAGITSILVDNNDLSDAQVNAGNAASEAYKNTQKSILSAGLALAKNEITQSQYNDMIQESYKGFNDLIDAIDDSTESGKQLVEIFRAASEELNSVTAAAQSAADKLEGMNAALDQMGGSGIPLARELSDAVGDIAKNGTLGKAALIALGAAAGKLAYDYFGAPIQAGIQASMDIKQNQIEGAKNVAQAGNDLAFAGKQAAMDFGYQLQEMAAQFNAASKTAFFGKGLGSVGYAASKLQLAGISAESIASATIAASKAGSGSTKLAADMAIFAERSGISVDNVANIQQAFKLLDGVSADTALNLAEGTRAMAESAGLNIGDVMNEVASASEMALDYQIQSGKALARQVVYAKSLGVSFSDVAKAGQNMVLNYKDSIKSEMSLSAMLGKNVNLSEVRAKFASGDTEGAMKSLQAQGLDPSKMNMFQQQALQQATGGMDLNSLKKIGTPGYQEGAGKVGALEEKSAKASNDAFLTLKQSAESALNTQQAMIQGQKAVAQAALDTMKENQWLNSQAYLDYTSAINQLNIERSFKENAGGALAASAGGLIGNFLPQITKGIGKLFKGGGAAATGEAGAGGLGMLGKAGKFLTKGGGGALAGIFGGVSGFMDKKEKGGTTGEAVGAGALQGGLAVAGAAIGTAFGGPIGTLVGGFLGDTLGGWINDNAPGVAARFGGLWDSVSSKFSAIGEKFKPVIDKISQAFTWLGEKFAAVYDAVNGFLVSLGFEEGLGSILSGLGEIIGTVVMVPFEWLMGAFGFIADIVGAFGQFLSGDFAGAWETLSTGFMDFIDTIIAPFRDIFNMLYNGFAKLWNGLADSWIGEALGLGKMEERKTEPAAAAAAKPQASITAETQQKAVEVANKPVVAASTANTKVNENIKKLQEDAAKEMKFGGNLQNEMVALLAANAAILEQIAYNTAGETPINLDGKRVNSTLLSNSRKAYGLSRA